MMDDYTEDLWVALQEMDEDEAWDTYFYLKEHGAKDYEKFVEKHQEAIPDQCLDRRADEYVDDYDWAAVEDLFKDKLDEEFELGPVAGKLQRELPVHGQDKSKPKV